MLICLMRSYQLIDACQTRLKTSCTANLHPTPGLVLNHHSCRFNCITFIIASHYVFMHVYEGNHMFVYMCVYMYLYMYVGSPLPLAV